MVSTISQLHDPARFLDEGRGGRRLRRGLIRVPQLWLIGVIALADAAGAAAQVPLVAAKRVVLVSPGQALESAARTALEPWAIEIAVVDGPSPGATAPRANETARELALAHAAGAVVWVSQSKQAYAVWVYDFETDQVLSRRLAGPPPFDAPAAAAVALSVKTLLRHSAAAPESERYGAELPPTAAEETAGAPHDATPAVASVRGLELDAQSPEVSADRRADAALSWLDLQFDVTLGFGLARSRGSVEPRFGGMVAFWPQVGPFGVSVRGAIGTGVSLDASRVDGRLLDVNTTLEARARHVLLRELQLSAAAGPGLHVTVLDGSLRTGGRDVRALRGVPSVELELAADWLASRRFRVGLRGGLSWLLRPQRYLVRGQPVLELSRTAFETGLTAALTLPD
jgi:hypothetical protein